MLLAKKQKCCLQTIDCFDLPCDVMPKFPCVAGQSNHIYDIIKKL